MSAGGEDESDVEEVVHDRGDREGDQVADEGIPLLEGILDPPRLQVIVRGKKGV